MLGLVTWIGLLGCQADGSGEETGPPPETATGPREDGEVLSIAISNAALPRSSSDSWIVTHEPDGTPWSWRIARPGTSEVPLPPGGGHVTLLVHGSAAMTLLDVEATDTVAFRRAMPALDQAKGRRADATHLVELPGPVDGADRYCVSMGCGMRCAAEGPLEVGACGSDILAGAFDAEGRLLGAGSAQAVDEPSTPIPAWTTELASIDLSAPADLDPAYEAQVWVSPLRDQRQFVASSRRLDDAPLAEVVDVGPAGWSDEVLVEVEAGEGLPFERPARGWRSRIRQSSTKPVVIPTPWPLDATVDLAGPRRPRVDVQLPDAFDGPLIAVAVSDLDPHAQPYGWVLVGPSSRRSFEVPGLPAELAAPDHEPTSLEVHVAAWAELQGKPDYPSVLADLWRMSTTVAGTGFVGHAHSFEPPYEERDQSWTYSHRRLSTY